ncbi:hypothetical protein [Salmonirosea aquatica]|uniref:Uncharacterized protein n=1 Tax=Salmonirosea aquatica TaxID=2654236 RepID=A0A7C9FZA5_9BACT|nr:hypothetical protein [Cytophagaceae bacterium SJW1-29]
MEPNPTHDYRGGQHVPAQIVPLTAEDRAFFEEKKMKISPWMNFLIAAAIAFISYKVFTSGATIWVSLGFCVFVGLCVFLFRYFFITKTNRILAHGLKHTGQARIAKKIAYQDSNGSASIFTLTLDWEFSKKIGQVQVSEKLYDQLQENDWVYLEASPLSKRPLVVEKVSPTNEI